MSNIHTQEILMTPLLIVCCAVLAAVGGVLE